MFENHPKSRIQHCERSESKCQMVNFGDFLKTWRFRSSNVTRQVNFDRTKIRGKCQNLEIQMRQFCWFSNNVSRAGEIGQTCRAFSQTFLTTRLSFQAFNENMKAGDKRMTAERCGYLSLVAIAHKLEEAWICFFPVLPLMYISQYLPTIGKRYSSIIVILDSSSCSFFSVNVWIELLQLCSALEDFFSNS